MGLFERIFSIIFQKLILNCLLKPEGVKSVTFYFSSNLTVAEATKALIETLNQGHSSLDKTDIIVKGLLDCL
jgi:hypothetical protein